MSDVNNAADAPKTRQRIVLAVLAMAGAAYLGHAVWFGAHYVETDNAQIGSDIAPISSRISGFVVDVPVRENQVVKKGDLLVTLDDRDAQARLAQAEADLASAMTLTGSQGQAAAQLQSVAAQAQQAHAVMTQVQAEHEQAARELQRARTLLQQGLISQQAVDQADALARTTAARLQATVAGASASQDQIGASRASLRGANAKLLVAQASRQLAANQLADTHIVAPFDGVISRKTIEPGQFMQPGQPMMNLVGQDSVWVVANLKETELAQVNLGNTADFSVDAYPDAVWHGQIESLSPATGSKFTLLPPDNATGNFTKVVQRIPVRVKIMPGQHVDLVLRAGMSAVVTITKS
ncbi:MAG: HlyD family secretion protein [Pseudomonadota bacterium]